MTKPASAPDRLPVVPEACGEFFWLPRFIGECEACGRRELLSNAGRCAVCDEIARAAARRSR